MKLPLTAFIHSILSYFRIALSQLMVGAWCILLGFKALCNCFLPEAYRQEKFCDVYRMKKGYQDAYSFAP